MTRRTPPSATPSDESSNGARELSFQPSVAGGLDNLYIAEETCCRTARSIHTTPGLKLNTDALPSEFRTAVSRPLSSGSLPRFIPTPMSTPYLSSDDSQFELTANWAPAKFPPPGSISQETRPFWATRNHSSPPFPPESCPPLTKLEAVPLLADQQLVHHYDHDRRDHVQRPRQSVEGQLALHRAHQPTRARRGPATTPASRSIPHLWTTTSNRAARCGDARGGGSR